MTSNALTIVKASSRVVYEKYRDEAFDLADVGEYHHLFAITEPLFLVTYEYKGRYGMEDRTDYKRFDVIAKYFYSEITGKDGKSVALKNFLGTMEAVWENYKDTLDEIRKGTPTTAQGKLTKTTSSSSATSTYSRSSKSVKTEFHDWGVPELSDRFDISQPIFYKTGDDHTYFIPKHVFSESFKKKKIRRLMVSLVRDRHVGVVKVRDELSNKVLISSIEQPSLYFEPLEEVKKVAFALKKIIQEKL